MRAVFGYLAVALAVMVLRYAHMPQAGPMRRTRASLVRFELGSPWPWALFLAQPPKTRNGFAVGLWRAAGTMSLGCLVALGRNNSGTWGRADGHPRYFFDHC